MKSALESIDFFLLWTVILLTYTTAFSVTRQIVQQQQQQQRPYRVVRSMKRTSTLYMSSAPSSISSNKLLSRHSNQQALRDAGPFPRTWVPLASAFELNPDRPNAVYFLGQEYIVYRGDHEQWVVCDAVCPHRLAPLSEGRIDRTSNVNGSTTTTTIECSYHGWAYSSKNGECVRIPQADATTAAAAMANPACRLPTYTTVVEKNIIWAWLWPEDAFLASSALPNHPAAATTPEHFLKGVLPNCKTYTRDVPYSWDTLLENIIDPSHVPHAHHGLQGKRSDAIPINMTQPSSISATGFNMTFADRTRNMMRQSTADFRAPFVIKYDGEYEVPQNKPPNSFNLTTILVPTKPGWSRIIIFGSQIAKSKDAKDSSRRTSVIGKIFGLLPVWLIHQLTNRFLDSDLVFLHVQDRDRERRSFGSASYGYFMPAPADRCVRAIRKWVNDYAHVLGPLPPLETKRQILFDRWYQHSDQCQHCARAAEGVKSWRNKIYWTMAACILLLHKYLLARVVAVGCLFLLRACKWVESTVRDGEFNHYKNH